MKRKKLSSNVKKLINKFLPLALTRIFLVVSPELFADVLLSLIKRREIGKAEQLLFYLFPRDKFELFASAVHRDRQAVEEVSSAVMSYLDTWDSRRMGDAFRFKLSNALTSLGYIALGHIIRPSYSDFYSNSIIIPKASNNVVCGVIDALGLQSNTTVNIILVGPAINDESQFEIDDYDVVCRIGYSGTGSLPRNTGRRCDIAFYAAHKLDKILGTTLEDELNIPKVLVLKNDNKKKVFRKIGKKAIYSLLHNGQLCYAEENAVPEFVFNLISIFQCPIYFCNVDLFTSPEYPVGYIGNKMSGSLAVGDDAYTLRKNGVCLSFGLTHNPGEQFAYLKYLRDIGMIVCDKKLENILDWSISEYIYTLQTIYGRES